MRKIWNDKTKTYFLYSILFIITACLVFSIFFINKRSFIWQKDGIKQHYIILKDFNQKVRGFLSNPSEGLDLFSWNMGLGLDVIGQYSYYILGDPFAYISLLFPMQFLEQAYNFLIILRLFCIGLAFIAYSQYHQKSGEDKKDRLSKYNVVIGALIYTFSAYSLFAGVRHPYFLNAMILFPLLLLGIDKLLRENKKIFFTFLVAISAISNYYFFYMLTIMVVMYAILFYICEYRKEGIKHFGRKLGSAILCYMIGVLIASCILMPTIYSFINSARSGEETICQYDTNYYKDLFSVNLLTVNGPNWSFIGVSSIILLMLPILWLRRKEHKVYLVYFLITTIMLLIPFVGSLMNGFSFPNNRWSFMYTFIMAYIITVCLESKYTIKELKYMGAFFLLYSIVGVANVWINKSKPTAVIYTSQIIITFFMFILILYENLKGIHILPKIDKFKTIILILVIGNISVMAYGVYSSYNGKYAKEFVKNGKVEMRINTQLGKNKDYSQNIQNILKEDKQFYRIAKAPHHIQNLSIYYQYPSTECFLSLGNKYVYELNRELADNNYSTTSSINGMGERTKITTLLGNKYYIVDEKNEKYVPYGYFLKEQKEQVKTYQNQYPLSIGICYHQYVLKEDYEKLNPIEKEELLLKAAIIQNKEEIKGLNMTEKKEMQDIHNCYRNLPYQVVDEEKIVKSKEIITSKKNQSINLNVEKAENAELYVYISGFEFQQDNKHTVTAEFNGKKVSKTIENRISSAYYQKAPEILLNLGYYEQIMGEIKLTFSTKGNYHFDNIQIIAVPMGSYSETIQALQKNELKEVKCTNREMSGNVNLEQDSILQIATSYTTGWKAYIDGEEVNTINVNTAFIGIPVKKGAHKIELKYEVPYLKIGMICSCTGIILLITMIIIEKRKSKVK